MNTPNPVPTTPAPVTAGAIVWYRSPQEIGLVTTAVSAGIAIFPKVGQFFGLTSPTDAANFVTNVFGFIAVVAPVVASVVRWKSKGQPLTLTASAAADHPATIAVKQVQAEMASAGIDTAMVRQAKNAAGVPVTPVPTSSPALGVPDVVPVSVLQPRLTATEVNAIADAFYLKVAKSQQAAAAAKTNADSILNLPAPGGATPS